MTVKLAEAYEQTSWMESETGFLVDRQKAETMHSSIAFKYRFRFILQNILEGIEHLLSLY